LGDPPPPNPEASPTTAGVARIGLGDVSAFGMYSIAVSSLADRLSAD